MLEVLINGETKKVACGPCIRGHRSAKCKHKDRVLIEIRKPGRPLQTCPHANANCGCQRPMINYTIPDASDEPSPYALPVAEAVSPPASSTGRVPKAKARKTSTSLAASSAQNALDKDAAFPDLFWDEGLQYEPAASSQTSSILTGSGASSTPRLVQSSHVSHQPPPAARSCCQGPSKNEEGDLSEDDDKKLGAIIQASFQTPPLADHQISFPSLFSPESQPSIGPLGNSTSRLDGSGFLDPLPDDSFFMYRSEQGLEYLDQLEKHCGCTSINPSLAQMANSSAQHICQCGQSCACLGCATHPSNRTTTEYVRYHDELLARQHIQNESVISPQVPMSFVPSQALPQRHYDQTLRPTPAGYDSSFPLSNNSQRLPWNTAAPYSPFQQYSQLEHHQPETAQNYQQFNYSTPHGMVETDTPFSPGIQPNPFQSAYHHQQNMLHAQSPPSTPSFTSFLPPDDVHVPLSPASTILPQEFWTTSRG